MTDLGNPEPKREGRNFIGMKTKLRIGSLLPIQLSCCAACRRKFQLASYAPVLTPVAAGVLSLVALGITPVRTALASLHAVVPLLLFVAVVGLAALLGRLWQASMLRRFEKETYMNIMEQPFLADLQRFGWFELQREKKMSHLIFSKERLKQGMYTK